MLSDTELVARAKRGDRVAFQELVEKYQKRVYAVAYGVLGNRESALDAVQETFIKAYRSLAGFKGKSSFYTWLYRITMNAAIDLGRKEAHRDELEFHDEIEHEEEKGEYPITPSAEDPGRELIKKELGEMIEDAIEHLPSDQRSAIILREIEGLSYKEIAKVMRCSEGTVMSRLHYGRKRLQELLKPYLES
jgi:RNA polymerase sigma-70 factor (ECF subfamily)